MPRCKRLGFRPQGVLVVGVFALLLSACGGGGSGEGADEESSHPIPTARTVTPSETLAGGGDFTLTVHGSNFVDNAVVRWNGVNLATAVATSSGVDRSRSAGFASELTATITAADIASAGVAEITVFNSAPGGGESAALIFTVANPQPAGSSLTPDTAIAGGAGFTLTVDGDHFVDGTVIRWNGVDRQTYFVSTTRMQADILGTDLAVVGMADVTLFTPAPGGGNSGALTFTVNNLVPQLNDLNPTNATEGTSDFVLTLSGADFVADSVVRWNGSDRTTRFLSNSLLEADITGADVASAGSATVTVFTPAPGGGSSSSVTFTIDPAVPSPVPALNSLAPRNANRGDNSVVVTLIGGGFVTNSVVRWNGSDRATTYVSDTEIGVTLSATDLASTGIGTLTVYNPSPGGGSSGPQSLFVLDSGVAYFYDDFERADGPSVGNDWTEKYAPAFSLLNGRLDSIATFQDYKDSIVYRPQAEDQLNVDLSVEFVRRAPQPGENGFPQLHARVQRNTITNPDTLESYIFFIEDFYLTPTAMIAVQAPLTGEFECYLMAIPLSDALQTDERYRLRFQVTGTGPVSLTGQVEWFTDGLWQTIGIGSVDHVAGMPLDPDLFCAQLAVPDPILSAGAVGTAKWQGVADYYDTFHWNALAPGGVP